MVNVGGYLPWGFVGSRDCLRNNQRSQKHFKGFKEMVDEKLTRDFVESATKVMNQIPVDMFDVVECLCIAFLEQNQSSEKLGKGWDFYVKAHSKSYWWPDISGQVTQEDGELMMTKEPEIVKLIAEQTNAVLAVHGQAILKQLLEDIDTDNAAAIAVLYGEVSRRSKELADGEIPCDNA